MHWFFYLTLLIIEVIAFASAVHALFTVRTTQGTIAWVIGLLEAVRKVVMAKKMGDVVGQS